MHPSVDPLLCMQLIRPENRRHLGSGGESDRHDTKELVVCLNEMKMGIIAKSVMFPGASTMVFNLLTSFAEGTMGLDESQSNDSQQQHTRSKKQSGLRQYVRKMMKSVSQRRNSSFGANGGAMFSDFSNSFDEDCSSDGHDSDDDGNNLTDGSWLEEYKRGCDWEIYTSPLSDLFAGSLFINVASVIYQKLGVILFALKIVEIHGRNRSRIILNPANFKIPSKEDFFVEGFVIAKNKEQSDLSFSEGIRGEDDHDLTLLKNGISKAIHTSSSLFTGSNDRDEVMKAVGGGTVPRAARFVRQHR